MRKVPATNKTIEERLVEFDKQVRSMTATDVTYDVPEVAILVVGNDERVTSALANNVRLFMEHQMGLTTVPLANLRTADNFVDYDEIREEHARESTDYQNDLIIDEVESIWHGMCNSYPAIVRGQMRVGVEIIEGNVRLEKEVRESADISVDGHKVVEQVMKKFVP
jgi:hypothetical protein